MIPLSGRIPCSLWFQCEVPHFACPRTCVGELLLQLWVMPSHNICLVLMMIKKLWHGSKYPPARPFMWWLLSYCLDESMGLRREILQCPYLTILCKNIMRARHTISSAFNFFLLQSNVALSCSVFDEMWISLLPVSSSWYFNYLNSIFRYSLPPFSGITRIIS